MLKVASTAPETEWGLCNGGRPGNRPGEGAACRWSPPAPGAGRSRQPLALPPAHHGRAAPWPARVARASTHL